MTRRRVCWTARSIIALNWIAIFLVLFHFNAPDAALEVVLWIFKISTIGALIYLVYESNLVTNRQISGIAWAVDAFFIVPMIVSWFPISFLIFLH